MMMRGWNSAVVVAVACVLAVVAAAAKTKIVESTASKQPREAPPRKILVLAVAADPITRASYEDGSAGELSLRGATAVASHLLFPELPKERGPFEVTFFADGFDAAERLEETRLYRPSAYKALPLQP